ADKHQLHKDDSPVLDSSPAVTEEVPAAKSQRRPKEVTLKSREPGRVQAFAPESPSESEPVSEHNRDHDVSPAETVSVTEPSRPESKTPETQSAPEQTDVPAAAVLPPVDALIKKEDSRQKSEQKTKAVSKAKLCHARKTNLPITENLEQKETAALESPQLRQAECEPKHEPLSQKANTARTPQNKSAAAASEAPSSAPQCEDQVKSPGLELQFPIVDDCPPRPAPFEHRIVSAKQVPLGSCYTVEPNVLLGGGRFGQVHKCAEISSGLVLAAKIIKVKGMKERAAIRNSTDLNTYVSDNVVLFLRGCLSPSSVEGGELFERIVNENDQLTELDAIVFMRQICEGVQYLHQQYILHLDLKPENILCVSSNSNQIKIIDFGLARKYRPREKLKVNFGTPEFLAPEVVNYDFVSFPTDMWSVGVITYMLLSGLSPFLGDNDAETMNNILHANWDFDSEAFENVSEEAKDFISKLLIPAKCSRLSASGCMKHSWLNNLEEKAKRHRVRLKSQMRLQRYLAAHRQWK
ncbi:myosin light chain kinase 3-like isoform X1, partial [Clarias magur]